jgi:hypothetical protein
MVWLKIQYNDAMKICVSRVVISKAELILQVSSCVCVTVTLLKHGCSPPVSIQKCRHMRNWQNLGNRSVSRRGGNS